MSGVGKSSVLSELSRRGHRTVDTDYGQWVRAEGGWDEPRMTALLSAASPMIISGTVENQGRFYDRFRAVILLSAPVDVLLHRLSARTNNPYGKSEGDQAEVRRYVRDVEPLLRRGATLELVRADQSANSPTRSRSWQYRPVASAHGKRPALVHRLCCATLWVRGLARWD